MTFRTGHRVVVAVAVLWAMSLGAIVPRARAQNEAAHQQFLFAYKLLQRDDHDTAARAFDDFLNQYPKDEKRGDALYYRALIAYQQQDHEMAVDLLREVPMPKYVPAYKMNYLRGQVHVEMEHFDHALAALEQIDLKEVEDAVFRASVHQLLGATYYRLENFGEAADSLQKASAIDWPRQAQSLYDLARVKVRLGQREKAIIKLRRCLRLGNREVSPQAALLGGNESFNVSDYQGAIAFYNIIIEGYPSSGQFSPAVLRCMWAFFRTGAYDQMAATHKQHREAFDAGERLEALYLVGSAHQEQSRHEQAVETLSSIADQSAGLPFHPTLLYRVARSCDELGRYGQMNTVLKKLYDLYPHSLYNMDGQFLIANADAEQGNLEDGIGRLSTIVDHEPPLVHRDRAFLRRAELYERNGQLETALDDYLKYFALPGKVDDAGHYGDHEAVLRMLHLQFRLNRYEAVNKTVAHLVASGVEPRVETEALYRQAVALKALERYDEAVGVFTDLLDRFADSPWAGQWHYYRGLLLAATHQFEQAEADLRIASEDKGITKALRANALRLAAMGFRERKLDERAADALVQLKRLTSLNGSEMLWMGNHLFEKGQLQQAIGYLEPLLDESRSLAVATRIDALHLTGLAHSRLEQHDQAITVFARLIEDYQRYLDPLRMDQQRLALAKTLRDGGRDQQALRQYHKLNEAADAVAAEALFDSAMIYRDVALRHRRADESVTAEEADRSAYDRLSRLTILYPIEELSPLPELSYLELADLLEGRGEHDKRLDALRDLAKKFPEGPYASYANAMLALDQKKRGDARFLLKRLSEQSSLDPRLAGRIAKAMLEMDESP